MFIVFVNQRAGWVKRRSLAQVEKRLSEILDGTGRVIVTQKPEDVAAYLDKVEFSDIAALVPVGGDGTLSAVLTAACQRWSPEKLPAILPLCAGTMNMVAIDARGHSEKPYTTLERIVKSFKADKALKVKNYSFLLCNGHRAGFVGGTGIPTRLLSDYYSGGGGFIQALRSITKYSTAVFLKNTLSKKMFEPMNVRLNMDGMVIENKSVNVVIGLTVDTIPLGFRLGTAKQGEGMTLIYGNVHARSLITNLPQVYKGLMPDSIGATRISCQRVSIELLTPQSWQLDGDILPEVSTLTMDARWCVDLMI